MASKDPEEPYNTETEEETIALRRKRLRRVSFADREITAVHIFNRDEDYETPPDSSAAKRGSAEEENEVLKFFGDLAADGYDSKEMSPEDDDDYDEIAATKSFLRPMESPGSSTIGSATSNDENNFFGPVSASFIRPGRLSDSAASDDNHDITMDSTAFSMHFRSLAKSETGDLRTPMDDHIAFEEKTPSQMDPGSFMELTKAKKPISQTPLPTGKASGCGDSNDMSLVGENPHKYDYGRLSPTLEALLADGGKNIHTVSILDSSSKNKSLKKSEVSMFNDNGSGCMNVKDHRDTAMIIVGPDDMSPEGVSLVHFKLGELNGGTTTTLVDQNTHDYPSNTNADTMAGAPLHHRIQTPNQLNKENKGFTEVVTGMLNVEFPAVSSGTPPDVNVNSNGGRLGLFSHHEPTDLLSTEACTKENSPNYEGQNSHISLLPDQPSGSPLAGSITLLSAKRKQIYLDAANLSRYPLYATPSRNHHGSFLWKENLEPGQIVSSIQKSNSKFRIVGSSGTSTLKDTIEKSRHKLLEYSSAISSINTVMEETCKDLHYKHLDVPIINLEKNFCSADMKKGEGRNTLNLDGDSCGTSMNFGSLNQNEETMGLVKGGESSNLSNLVSSEDKLTKTTKAVVSFSQLTWSGKKETQHPLMSDNPMEGTFGISGSDSLSVEVKVDHGKDQKVADNPNKFGSPPTKRSDQKLSSLARYPGTLSGDLKQQDQCVMVGSGLDGNSIEYSTIGSHLSGTTDNLDSLSIEQGTQSYSPLLNISPLKELTQVKRVDDRGIYLPDMKNVSEIIRNFQTPSREMGSLKFKLGSPSKNLQIADHPTQTKEELPGEGMKASPRVPASPYGQRRSLKEPSLLKSPSKKLPSLNPTCKKSIWSPSRKELCISSPRDQNLFIGEDRISPKSNSDGHGNDDCLGRLHNSQNPCPLQDSENSSRRKRSEVGLGDTDNAYKTGLIQRSPKVHKSGGSDSELILKHIHGSTKGNKTIGGEATLQHWTDVYQKFSTETNQIRSPLVDKLSIEMVGKVEDILVHLEKVNKYEMLCSEILSQKMYNQSSNITHKRVAETRRLLSKIVFEKAKLQILHVKHEKFLEKRQLLSSGILKSQILKMDCVRHLSAPCERDTQVDDNLQYSSSAHFQGKLEVAVDNVTTVRREFEAVVKRTLNLVKSFHAYCKMEGELSSTDTVLLLKDQLKKRTFCRTICQDLQLWEIGDLEKMNGHYNLVLNYRGFICKRFTTIADSFSSIVISNKVNDINITKNFPNMDACVAFAFVFNAEFTKKSFGSKSFAQETQTTSSLLCNLLAVVEEVQLARIEIRNLTGTSFYCPSVEQLDLQLSFIDFSSGRRVTMTLDMTCLNRGVYPKEILPYQLQMQKSLPESLSADIKVATGNLRIGYSRILMLCKCVSKVILT